MQRSPGYRRTGTVVAVLGVLGALVASCGVDSSPGNTAAARHQRARNETAAVLLVPGRSYADFLPSAVYNDIRTGAEHRPSELFVLGEVVDAQVARFFANRDEELGPDLQEVGAGHQQAAFATLHVIVQPALLTDAHGEDRAQEHDRVVIGLTAPPAEAASYAAQLAGFGTVAAPLVSTELFGREDGVYSVYANGMFFAVVEEERLDMVFMPDAMREELGLGSVGLDEVEVGARAVRRIDVIDLGAQTFVRTDDADMLAARGIDIETLVAQLSGD